MPQPIRILIADDDRLVRAAIRSLLEQDPTLEVVGEAADGEEVVVRAHTLTPDVVLLDLVMPRKSGLAAIAELKQQNPAARILVLTGFADEEMGLEAVKAGATGYLLKTAAVPDLIRAIHMVYQGDMPLHAGVVSTLIRKLNYTPLPPIKREPLTQREVTILRLVARGLSNHDVAQELSVTETTVRTHMNRILHKLQMTSRTQATLYALKRGLATLETD
jgi:NarL family two-component system response regulator LiaR